MENLPVQIEIVNNKPVVSTLVIAENIDKPNKTIVQLINNNMEDFLEFQDQEISNFEVQEIGVNGKAGYARYYNLNEQQSTLLITYLRNNDKVKEFKKNLVKAFFMMKERLQNQLQPQEQNILPVLVEMAKVNQMLVQSNQEIVANLTNMNAGLHEMLATMHNIKHDTSKIKENMNNQESLLREVRQKQSGLTPVDIVLLKEAIEKRAKELSNGDAEKIQALTRSIYSYINGYFNVSAYYFMTWEQSIEAQFLIKNLNIGVQNA